MSSFFSKFACIYTEKLVWVHANLDKSATLILEPREYLAARYQIYEMINQLFKISSFSVHG
jgi:hypothetical protein